MIGEIFARVGMHFKLQERGLDHISVKSVTKTPDAFMGRHSYTAEFTAAHSHVSGPVRGTINYDLFSGGTLVHSNMPGSRRF